MNKRHYEHTLPNIRGSLSNTYNAPVFGNIKKLVVRETDITAFNPVYLVLDILVHCIPFAAVPLLQAFYLDVLKAVGFRLII